MARVTDGLESLSDVLYALVGEPRNVRRVVIDIKSGDVPIIHIERFGDESLIEVVRALGGVEITRSTGAVVPPKIVCPSHGPHPHDGRRCLDCPKCAVAVRCTCGTRLDVDLCNARGMACMGDIEDMPHSPGCTLPFGHDGKHSWLR